MTDELRRLAEKATPGPWKGNRTVIWRDGDPALDDAIARNDPKAGPIIASEFDPTGRSRPSKFVGSTFGEPVLRGANAAYIAAANPQRILALLDVVQAAREMRTLCDCSPDWLMQDGSHHPDCIQSCGPSSALREALDRLEALA